QSCLYPRCLGQMRLIITHHFYTCEADSIGLTGRNKTSLGLLREPDMASLCRGWKMRATSESSVV
ncbi:MAG: hypothetical protein PHX74_08340, partial [Candidatus Sumerlaeales bacterium]|nr:hypothetical protein [Candidatus Sumerlaeales bacterium]